MIALNGHPFQPAALQQYVDQATAQRDPDKAHVVVAAVDNNGVRVALIFAHKTEEGNLRFELALAHDWSGDTIFGARGSYSF